MMQGQLTDPKSILSFILAGNATVTFRSAKTGTRYTYKIQLPKEKRQPNDPDSWFVKLLTGADNQSSYTYIGMIRNGKFGTTRASKLDSNSVPVKTFTWVMDNLQRGVMPQALEVWHEGRCGKCGRKLTVPESIATGFGPDCAANMVDLPLIHTSTTPVIDQPKQGLLPLSAKEEKLQEESYREQTFRGADPMVTIQGVTMPLSQADATAKAIESLDLNNVPELD